MKIRKHLADINREYLQSRQDRRETVETVIALVIILAGLFIAAWAWGG